MIEVPQTCRNARDWLLEQRGSLPIHIQNQLQTHLAKCDSCRAASEWDRWLTVKLCSIMESGDPERTLGRVQRSIIRRRYTRRLTLGLTACLAVGLSWVAWASRTQTIREVTMPGNSMASEELDTLAGLFAPPPVDPLDRLGRHESGTLRMLDRMQSEQ